MIRLKILDSYIEKSRELLKNERAKKSLIIGITAVTGVLYISFLIVPKVTELARVSQKISNLNDKIDVVNTRVKRLNQLTREMKELIEENKSYSERLPVQKDISELLEGFSTVARSSKVKLLSITPSALKVDEMVPGSEKYYMEMPVRITARGGYHQLGYFVNSLEQGERLIIIKDLSLKYDPANPWAHNIVMTLTAYVSVE
ncbi:MAG: type 4a pilus biogenesis protein PilO [Candidatus Omnitrophota bacterium]